MSTARLVQIDRQIGRAMVAVAEDRDVSSVLARSVKELYRRSQEAIFGLRRTDAPGLWRVVRELESIGSIVRTQAEDDPAAADQTRRAVHDAHHALLRLRLDLGQSRRNPRIAD